MDILWINYKFTLMSSNNTQTITSIKKILSVFNWKFTKCAFTMTTGRTGTLTLIKLLNLSPEIKAYHEPLPHLREYVKTAYNDIYINQEKYANIFREARCNLIFKSWIKGHTYVEHTVMTSFCPSIAIELPNSKFIHIFRHPADVIRSGLRRRWYQGHAWDDNRIEPTPDDPNRSKWDTQWDPLLKVCWNWNYVNNFIIEFSKNLPKNRFLAVKFERLINKDTDEYLRVFSFLNVDPPNEKDVRKILNHKYNAQENGKFPKYEEWTVQNKQNLLDISGETM